MIKVRYEGEAIIVSLFQVSKLNMLFTSVVEKQIVELFNENKKTVYFDLGKIKFIDSSGFEMLLRLVKISRETNREFLLCNITDEVEELVNLLKIDQELPIVHKKFDSESLMEEIEVFN